MTHSPSTGKAAADLLVSKFSSSIFEAGPGSDCSGVFVGSLVAVGKAVFVAVGVGEGTGAQEVRNKISKRTEVMYRDFIMGYAHKALLELQNKRFLVFDFGQTYQQYYQKQIQSQNMLPHCLRQHPKA